MLNSTFPTDFTNFFIVIPATLLGLIDSLIIAGNGLVIAAVITSYKLRTVTNMFIVSLACADLLLGLVVLPFSISKQVVKRWMFGTVWCSIWLAVDVWMCTASILNLCAISLDRYIAITRPFRYPAIINWRRGKILVFTVWISSFIICFPPLLGWKSDNSQGNGGNNTKAECNLTSEPGYIIYSALGSFYIPMCIMTFFYWRIYVAARRTASSPHEKVTLRVHRGGAVHQPAAVDNVYKVVNGVAQAHQNKKKVRDGNKPRCKNVRSHLKKVNKETKAAKTVGIIVGCFIFCWLPFFTIYFLGAFDVNVPVLAFDVFFWLGYCNSVINPCIYALFSKDFRFAFQRLLCCKCKDKQRKPKTLINMVNSLRHQVSSNPSESGSE